MSDRIPIKQQQHPIPPAPPIGPADLVGNGQNDHDIALVLALDNPHQDVAPAEGQVVALAPTIQNGPAALERDQNVRPEAGSDRHREIPVGRAQNIAAPEAEQQPAPAGNPADGQAWHEQVENDPRLNQQREQQLRVALDPAPALAFALDHDDYVDEPDGGNRRQMSLQEVQIWFNRHPNVLYAIMDRTEAQCTNIYGREFHEVVFEFIRDYEFEMPRNLANNRFLGVQIRVGVLPSPESLEAELANRYIDFAPLSPRTEWQSLAMGIHEVPVRNQRPPVPSCHICLCRPHGMPIRRHSSMNCPYAYALSIVAVLLRNRTCWLCAKRDGVAARPNHVCRHPAPCSRHDQEQPAAHATWTRLCEANGAEKRVMDALEDDIRNALASAEYLGFPLPTDRDVPTVEPARRGYPGLMMANQPLSLPPNYQEIIRLERRLKVFIQVMEQFITRDGHTAEQIDRIANQLALEEDDEAIEEENRLREQQIAADNARRAAARRNPQPQPGFHGNAGIAPAPALAAAGRAAPAAQRPLHRPAAPQPPIQQGPPAIPPPRVPEHEGNRHRAGSESEQEERSDPEEDNSDQSDEDEERDALDGIAGQAPEPRDH